jgi:hypothetical protein
MQVRILACLQNQKNKKPEAVQEDIKKEVKVEVSKPKEDEKSDSAKEGDK